MTWAMGKLNDHLTKRGVRLDVIKDLLPQVGSLRVYNGVYDPTTRRSVLFCLDYSHAKEGARVLEILMKEGFSKLCTEKEGRKISVWPSEDTPAFPKTVFLLAL